MGAVHQAKQEYDLAIESYKKALEIDPAYKNALLRLGQTYQLKAEEVAGGADAADNPEAARIAGEAAAVYENYLAENPDDVEVQLFHGPVDSLGEIARPHTVTMAHNQALDNGAFVYYGAIPCRSSGQHGFAVRILPKHAALANPFTTGLVCWG